MGRWISWFAVVLASTALSAQQGEAPKGEVIFQSHGAPAAAKEAAADAVPEITDAERSAITVTAYDLDARLNLRGSGLAMRAKVTVRNDGAAALKRVALQVSSSLMWESVTLVGEAGRVRLPLAQHLVETDADHTGNAREAVLTLPSPLAAGASVALDAFYSGKIVQDSTRLERIGAAHDEAAKADWDAIGEEGTALRGFGDVLWYPVAAAPVFLGQGAQLFDAIGATKLRESAATVHLRLSAEYAGGPPVAAYFCGRRLAFATVSDNVDAPVGNAPGLATVEFPAAPLGFRVMSLFLIGSPETAAGPLAIETTHDADVALVTANAKDSAALLADWLGPQPLSSLAVLDHAGQPFEDGPLLVAPVSALGAPEAVPALTHSLTHAWVQTGRPWMDEGLAQFFVLLGVERVQGREAAVAQMGSLLQPLTLAEPALEAGKAGPVGQPLPNATSEFYYRRKAAAVWWMLRDLAGNDALKQALQAWRVQPVSTQTAEQDVVRFEGVLEKASGKDLKWFFDDWVLHDRGLPDLTIVDITPRELAPSLGKSAGWLVSVTVRNDGAAVADVPLVIRSGSFSTTQRLRVPGFGSTSTRVVVEAPPTQVLLNDGGTPEQRASMHTRDIVVHGK